MYTLILIMFGAAVGWLASVSGRKFFWDLVLGIIGSIAGGFIINSFGLPAPSGYGFYSFIAALMGAVLIIYIGRVLEQIPLN